MGWTSKAKAKSKRTDLLVELDHGTDIAALGEVAGMDQHIPGRRGEGEEVISDHGNTGLPIGDQRQDFVQLKQRIRFRSVDDHQRVTFSCVSEIHTNRT